MRQRLAWSFAPWFARISPRRLAEHLDRAIALDDSDSALLARLYQSRAFTASNSGEAEAAERYLETSAQLIDIVEDTSVRETHDYIRTALHVRAESYRRTRSTLSSGTSADPTAGYRGIGATRVRSLTQLRGTTPRPSRCSER